MRRLPHRVLAILLVAGLVVAIHVNWMERGAAPPPTAAEPLWKVLSEPSPPVTELRIHAKRMIARDVAAGRRTLIEAAALFGVLNRQPPMSHPLSTTDAMHTRLRAPVRTDDERLCRQVVDWVHSVLRDAPDGRAEAAVARLTAEYVAEVSRAGGLRLPDSRSLESAEDLLARAERERADQRQGKPNPADVTGSSDRLPTAGVRTAQ